MNTEKYETPEMDVIEAFVDDVVCTSGCIYLDEIEVDGLS